VSHHESDDLLLGDERLHKSAHLVARNGIERAERFVEQQDPRRTCKGSRQSYTLTFSATQRACASLGERAGADARQPVLCHLTTTAAVAVVHRKRHVVERRTVLEQCGVLVHHTQSAVLRTNVHTAGGIGEHDAVAGDSAA